MCIYMKSSDQLYDRQKEMEFDKTNMIVAIGLGTFKQFSTLLNSLRLITWLWNTSKSETVITCLQSLILYLYSVKESNCCYNVAYVFVSVTDEWLIAWNGVSQEERPSTIISVLNSPLSDRFIILSVEIFNKLLFS